jgi:hypothetical protein
MLALSRLSLPELNEARSSPMPLIFMDTTAESPDLTGIVTQANDAVTGRPVVVKVFHEAIRDYRVDRVREAAEAKYHSGKFESDKSIRVRVADVSR